MNIKYMTMGVSLIFLLLGSACVPAGSMRVDVEVYKGPLANSRDIQFEELRGIVEETKSGLTNFYFLTLDNDEYMKKFDTNGTHEYYKDIKIDKTKFKKRKQVLNEGVESLNNTQFRNYISFKINLLRLNKKIGKLNCSWREHKLTTKGEPKTSKKDKKNSCEKLDLKALLEQTTSLAHQLKSSAFFWGAYSNFSEFPKPISKVLIDYANITSQFGNQLASRADALHKQFFDSAGESPISKEEFPLSYYLRDTRPTDFSNLYLWNEEFDLDESKANIFRQLFSNNFWSNINTVYASGVGDANMAFVKNQIGNWTLKSFESDPSELVDAYKSLTLAAIKSAAKVAATSATGIPPGALEQIGKLTSGKMSSGIDPEKQLKLKALKEETLKELDTLKKKNLAPDATIAETKRILNKYNDVLTQLQGS